MRGLRATHNPDHSSPRVGGSMRGGNWLFLARLLGAWQLNGAQANLGVLLSRRGRVRGDPCNALLGLGATKRRGVLSMTERHLGTLPLKDVGKKDPTNRTLYDARHVALAFCLDKTMQRKEPRHNAELAERVLNEKREINAYHRARGKHPLPFPEIEPTEPQKED